MSKLNKALKLLNQKGLDGLVIYSSGAYRMTRPNYVYCFSGFRPLGSNNAIIISKSGDITLLVEPQWDSARASRESWINAVIGTSDFTNELPAVIKKLKAKGTIGVAGLREMTEELYLCIEKEATIELADDIMEEITRVKTREEMDAIRRTAKIADVGFKAFVEHAQIGIREYELAAEIEFAMRSSGAEDNFMFLSSGEHNHAMHAPSDRKLSKGDIVIAEISPFCRGQFLQLCRTVFLGEPGSILTEKYDMLVCALEESLKHIKSGASASLVSKAINKVIIDAGYGEYCYPPYMRTRGHGTGPGSVVGSFALGGAIDDNTKAKFKEQQLVVVHPNQYFPETGYLACGETIMVTDTGIERLSDTETKLYSKEAC
ncbi:M24 family metallopeptidase [Chloroflexota bacterium]